MIQRSFMPLLRLVPLILLAAMAVGAHAQSVGLPSINVQVGGLVGGTPKSGGQDVSASLQVLALLTVLSIAPALLILTTAFTRIVIILSFVRQALGTQTIPPNQVLVGLALFLTFFVMAPTYTKINDDAIKPYTAKQIDMNTALDRAQKPIREFMLKNTYETDLRLFVNMRHLHPKGPSDVDFVTLVPAFVISELKTAFIIGFYVFLPFLVIDLVVASGLMSMGMMMMPPTIVALPAKILVFVLANGWATLAAAILSGYR
jgi:flagellar biosynthetic protein FliP